jgi:ferredoxin-NADP reductase
VLLIGAGVGIAPLRALLEELPAGPGEVTLLYRASKAAEVLFRPELDALAADRGANVYYLLGSRFRYPNPLKPAQLTQLVPELSHHDVYVCGPPQLMSTVVDSLRVAGVPRRRIHTEGFEYG